MLVSRLPWPLDKGDKLRAYHQARELSREHEVFLCCLSDTSLDPEHIAIVSQAVSKLEVVYLSRSGIYINLVKAFFSRKPFQVAYFFQKKAARKIHSHIQSFNPDHLYCQMVRASEYIKRIHHIPKTIDYMDALSKGYERRIQGSRWLFKLFVRKEFRRLAAYEHLIFDYFDGHCIISAQDRKFIFHPEAGRIAVIPNGIDEAVFSPISRTKEYDLVFTGNMSYPPNVDGAIFLIDEILPLIRSARPDTTLLIAGTSPAAAISKRAGNGIYVSGRIPDMSEAYASANVFIAPMRIGSGLQNKLLEAMSMELPCVSTSLANNALMATPNQQIMVGDTPEELASHCIYLLANKDASVDLARAGRQFVLAKYNWRTSTRLLTDLFSFGSKRSRK